MAEFQAIHTYFALLLILFVCHEVLLTQGRQIKPLNRPSLLDIGGTAGPTVQGVATSAEKIPNHQVAGFGDSGAEYTNAFRPTTPGNSPGVGHRKFTGQDKDIKAKVVVQSPDVNYSSVTEGSKTDFRPTDPGHSPGVGHAAAYQNENGELRHEHNQFAN